MFSNKLLSKLEKQGEYTIVYTIGVDMSDNNTLAVTKLNELCELDSGVEIHRTISREIPMLKYQGKIQEFNVVYATPDCKKIAEDICKRDRATLKMFF